MIMLCAIDWVAVGSISSAIMAFLTLVIIYQNMQARKGVLVIDIEKDDEWIWLTMSNIGETLINEIRFNFDDDIKNIASDVLKNNIRTIENYVYALKPHETKKVQLETREPIKQLKIQDGPPAYDRTIKYYDILQKAEIRIQYRYRTIYGCHKKAGNTLVFGPDKLLFAKRSPGKKQE